MFLLVLFFLIRLVDLPILDDYPYIKIWIYKPYLTKLYPANSSLRAWIERRQYFFEKDYETKIGYYEFLLIITLFWSLHFSKLYEVFIYKILIFLILLYGWWTNLIFFTVMTLMPVFFYYFFLLADYYEVLEELLEYIKARL